MDPQRSRRRDGADARESRRDAEEGLRKAVHVHRARGGCGPGRRWGQLLDVREPAEWRAGHAPRARHIPLAGRVEEVPADRPVITLCRSGARSRQAAALLARDHHQIYNVVGGTRAWSRPEWRSRRKGGRPGHLTCGRPRRPRPRT
ncbi:rhodanese-like domain-containing protein [Micromonospora marina]|uniref:rhodanese-like domain-containing protein n=1 Tax=Micromonospora marina TaxID=307120 RepID=UPI003D705530